MYPKKNLPYLHLLAGIWAKVLKKTRYTRLYVVHLEQVNAVHISDLELGLRLSDLVLHSLSDEGSHFPALNSVMV